MDKKKKKVKRQSRIKTPRGSLGHILGLDLSLKGTGGTVLGPPVALGHRGVVGHFFCSDKKGLTDTLGKRKDVLGGLYLPTPKGGMTELAKVTRLDTVLQFLMEQINSASPAFVAIEDYAYAAKGSQFHIGELTGAVKLYLWRRGIPFRMYDPPTIKKFGTGSGNADKADILMACLKDFGMDFTDYGKIKDNVADSYVIAKLLEAELDVRQGRVGLDKVKKQTREIMQRTTKTYPVNILERPFIKENALPQM